MWRTILRLLRLPSRWEMRREGRRGRRATTTRAWSSTFSPATRRATRYIALITRNLSWQNFFSLHFCLLLGETILYQYRGGGSRFGWIWDFFCWIRIWNFPSLVTRCLLGSWSGTYREKSPKTIAYIALTLWLKTVKNCRLNSFINNKNVWVWRSPYLAAMQASYVHKYLTLESVSSQLFLNLAFALSWV